MPTAAAWEGDGLVLGLDAAASAGSAGGTDRWEAPLPTAACLVAAGADAVAAGSTALMDRLLLGCEACCAGQCASAGVLCPGWAVW